MTGKRYFVSGYSVWDSYNDNRRIDTRSKPICDLLNQWNDENEQLKSFKSRVFNLLQDEIREESELLDYYLKEKEPYNADRQQVIIGVLKRLQKELEE